MRAHAQLLSLAQQHKFFTSGDVTKSDDNNKQARSAAARAGKQHSLLKSHRLATHKNLHLSYSTLAFVCSFSDVLA